MKERGRARQEKRERERTPNKICTEAMLIKMVLNIRRV